MTMQSGVPVAVTQANSLGYAGFTTQRPNLVGDPTVPADERTPARWFNTAAFARPISSPSDLPRGIPCGDRPTKTSTLR
jgi:hypothetical protein